MLTNNFAVYGTKILVELAGSILYFPLWWYSRGLVITSRGILNWLSDRERSLALLVWIKNIHRPMYGQYDWQGILISFVMRLVQILARSMIMLVWVVVAVAMFLLWLGLPLLVYYEIVFQLT